ncbi:T9SS type A sorting domain-containing protein [Pedobacter arcticus]|uniref:T9SS type A sorting domain-containing protein n=1 Tax=Pedobacter arcticus TaxID=752140 RepID=UPI0002FBF692|nr:T9SS type A sorting domain-containing protein [Pedobacter arcticus]
MKKILPILSLLLLPLSQLFAQCTTPGNVIISGTGIASGANTGVGCTDRVVIYTASTSTGATNYVWNITGTSGITQISPTQYSVVFENSNVTIEVTPMNGACAGNKSTVTITVASIPNRPSVQQTGNNLDANVTAAKYQWYLGNTPITGATSKTFSPTTNGAYIVEAYNASGCSVYSSPFNFFQTAIQEDAIFNNFRFYPNPVVSNLNIDFSKRYDLSLIDLRGQQVMHKNDLQNKQEIDLSSLKRGLYLMKITSDGKTAVRKLLLK